MEHAPLCHLTVNCTDSPMTHSLLLLLSQAANSFPKDIANTVRSDESLIPKGDKKAMQRVMPFLQFVAAEVRARPAD